MKGRIGLWFAVMGTMTGIAVAQTVVGQGGGGAVSGVLGGVISAAPAGALQAAPAGAFQSSASFSVPTANFGVMGGVSGAPYSGEQVNQTVQTLLDGTHITRTSSSQRTWRDSQGRTRIERQMGGGMTIRPNMPKPPAIIEIRDPVAGVGYVLDTEAKVAHRIAMQQPQGMSAVRPVNSAMSERGRIITMSSVTADGVENKTESLGNQTVEGVMAMGSRTTTIYPAGYDGNDRPITTTQESWTCPELGLMVLSKRYDPRNGESTQKIANLSRNEPDITMFQPPADYSVVDETGPMVTIRYSR
jgi:hypothetical protein